MQIHRGAALRLRGAAHHCKRQGHLCLDAILRRAAGHKRLQRLLRPPRGLQLAYVDNALQYRTLLLHRGAGVLGKPGLLRALHGPPAVEGAQALLHRVALLRCIIPNAAGDTRRLPASARPPLLTGLKHRARPARGDERPPWRIALLEPPSIVLQAEGAVDGGGVGRGFVSTPTRRDLTPHIHALGGLPGERVTPEAGKPRASEFLGRVGLGAEALRAAGALRELRGRRQGPVPGALPRSCSPLGAAVGLR
mmetsp:Transcript_45253/g.130699  ORF Transcript_45253/g.130699 Transcript_45253/m.130699 type:complete len:251 (+) Transcript_45253:1216-1968(+)